MGFGALVHDNVPTILQSPPLAASQSDYQCFLALGPWSQDFCNVAGNAMNRGELPHDLVWKFECSGVIRQQLEAGYGYGQMPEGLCVGYLVSGLQTVRDPPELRFPIDRTRVPGEVGIEMHEGVLITGILLAQVPGRGRPEVFYLLFGEVVHGSEAGIEHQQEDR